MSSKPQIFVFHLKEVIYTAIFILLGLLFLLLLFIMFKPDSDKKEENGGVSSNNTNATVSYVPGTYSTTVNLNGQSFEVQVTTAEDQITDISLVSVDSSVSTLYPLLEPTMASLSEQIYENQSLEDLTVSEDATYTSDLLIDAISSSIAMAASDATASPDSGQDPSERRNSGSDSKEKDASDKNTEVPSPESTPLKN